MQPGAIDGQSLDGGNGEFDVLGEFAIPAAQAGVVLLQPDVGIGCAGGCARRTGEFGAQVREVARKVVLAGPRRVARASALGVRPVSLDPIACQAAAGLRNPTLR